MSDTKENIKLIAKLLNADKSSQTNIFGEIRDDFYDELGKNFRSALEESSVPEKAEIFDGIVEIADDMEIFGTIPELLGKTFVGVVGFDRKSTETFMTRIMDEKAAKTLMLDTNLPVIAVAGDGGISTVNDVGNPVALNSVEYAKTNRSLWRDKIDVPQILQFFLLKRAGFFQNIAVIFLPEYFDSRTPFAEMIFRKLDAVTIFVSKLPDRESQQKLLDEFFKLKNRRMIPFTFSADGQNVGELTSDKRFRGVSFQSTDEIFRVFEQLNVERQNCFFADAINCRLLEIRNFYEKKIRQLKTDRSQIAEDLVRLTVDDTREVVRDLQAENRRELNSVELEFEKLRGASTLLLDRARKYESAAEKYFGGQATAHCSEFAKDVWRKIFFRAMELPDFQLAAEYARKLSRFDEAYGYVCETVLRATNNEHVAADNLERLRRESDNEFIRRAKLRVAEKLQFSDFDCMQIARDINSVETAQENYFRGLWFSHAGDKQTAVNYFKRALKQGYSRAGTKLFELADGDLSALLILSDQMVPEANFALGNRNLSANRYDAIKYFKLAAAKNYIPAVKFLVDDFSAKLLRTWHASHSLTDTEKTQAQSCIEIYGAILKTSPDVSLKERVGDLYHALGDDRRALSWWTQCDTADSCYKLGRLYQYTDGTFEQDLDAAERFFSQAVDKGHAKASRELTKVRQWKESNIRQQQARQAKKQNFAPRVVYSDDTPKSSGGLCVITSAACAALNKADDCEELNTLRAYRDKMKAENPVVAALVKEYYRVAPVLVEKINAELAADTIYSSLWENFIARTYNLIRAGENDAATAIYVDMVQKLCDRYDVQLSAETLENICRLNFEHT